MTSKSGFKVHTNHNTMSVQIYRRVAIGSGVEASRLGSVHKGKDVLTQFISNTAEPRPFY